MKEIPLTQGKIAIVDDDLYEMLITKKWHFFQSKRSKTGYAARSYWQRGKCQQIFMHTEILGVIGIDHINGNGLDNRRENLRQANTAQNCRNRGKISTKKNFKGVFEDPKSKQFIAKVKMNRKNYYLGRFDSEIEAALTYDAKVKELFGEFARTNFPRVSVSETR